MKILVTESQLKGHTDKLKELINRLGFEEVVKMTGLSKLKLAQLVSTPIDVYSAEDDIPNFDFFLDELVKNNENYKNCELVYDYSTSNLDWICDFEDGNNINVMFTRATPYYDALYETSVEPNYVIVYTDGEGNEYDIPSGDYIESFENPNYFRNADEMIDWFESVYKPKVYRIIYEKYKEIKKVSF